MTKSTSSGWLQAGVKLGEDPSLEIACPECCKTFLKVKDIEAGTIVERHLFCPKCNARNSLRMSNPVKIRAADYTKV